MRFEKTVILDWDTMSYVADELKLDKIANLTNQLRVFPKTAPEEAAERIQSADAVLCNKVPLTADVLKAARKLKYIGVFATGYNNVDVEEAARRGIPVCNAGSYSTEAVTQLVFAYILDHCRRVSLYSSCVRLGEWEAAPTFSYFPYPATELNGKTLAVIGYGSIGQNVARIAEAFGMRVIVHTRTPKPMLYQQVTLEQAFEKADYLTIHCPLTDQTRHMVNWKTLGRMKSTAVLINTSRGGVVAEKDLAEALNEGRIAAAYLDVLETEPMSHDTPLRLTKNCTITPHVGWIPLETRQRLMKITEENLRGWLSGEPQNVVNGVQVPSFTPPRSVPRALAPGEEPEFGEKMIERIQPPADIPDDSDDLL